MKYSTDVECRSDSLAVISYRDINVFTYVNTYILLWTRSPQLMDCGMASRADEFLRRLASIVVTRRTGYSEGPNFSPNYVRHSSSQVADPALAYHQ